jgi:beta-apo-4'-carotenal oxygenase
MMDVRYPPYTAAKRKKVSRMQDLKPDFDREGRVIGWGAWLRGLLGFKSLAAVVGE